ncbi:MAG: lamin tail domain-containing protein [Fidelibacterota bacterium]
MKNRIILFLFLSFSWASTHRIMAYNVLNFSGGDAAKESALRIVIDNAAPDIIITEEIQNQAGYNAFLANVLNNDQGTTWAGAPFTDQNQTNVDIALFYKPEFFTFISTSRINTTSTYGRRDVIEFVMQHNASGLIFRLYGAHLKAGSTTSDENERTAEATELRNYLNTLDPETPFLLGGDFNVYDNAEGGFQALIESQSDNDGQCFDPVNRIGVWHNNSSYSDVHTQSSRGGNYGGMDDRFDWLFASASILSDTDINYVPGSYQAYGNDGNHFNMAINDGSNAAVSATVANALYDASDHIPVILDLEFDDIVYATIPIVISEVMANPSRVSDSYGEWIELYNNDTVAWDLQDWVIRDLGSDYHQISTSLVIQPGDYVVIGRNGDGALNGGVPVDYVANSFVLSNTEDEIILLDSVGRYVDEIDYTSSFPYENGASMHIREFALDNNDPSSWYTSQEPYGAGDLGTPGRAWNQPLTISPAVMLPARFQLANPYPNPFNPRVTIPVDITEANAYRLSLWNLQGQEVAMVYHGFLNPDSYLFSWHPINQGAGVYFLVLKSGSRSQTKKIIYLK